ncbi:MAG TPA: TetR/AcrR family transcriptional regulator [Bdellovibrio sp.]|nr:TetR/AcrR family transcriptional regulator [Bdellovibrio sp.]
MKKLDKETKKIQMEILTKLIDLENSKGHLLWKVSELARLSKVSRPLIYYHFGKTKKEIFKRALDIVSVEYFGITPERIKMLSEGRAWESVLQTRELILKYPSYLVFYLKWRTSKSPLKEHFIEIEKKYQAHLQSNFPHFSKAKILALHALLFGTVISPFLTNEALAELEKLTRKL